MKTKMLPKGDLGLTIWKKVEVPPAFPASRRWKRSFVATLLRKDRRREGDGRLSRNKDFLNNSRVDKIVEGLRI